MTTRAEVKVTIAKLLEVAYSKNKGITTKIIRKKGNFAFWARTKLTP